MKNFKEWLEQRNPELAESILSRWAAPTLVAASTIFGGGATPAKAETPIQQEAGYVKQIAPNVYEVQGIGRVSRIGGPNAAFDSAEKDAKTKLLRHLKINTAKMSVEAVKTKKDSGVVYVTYQITLR